MACYEAIEIAFLDVSKTELHFLQTSRLCVHRWIGLVFLLFLSRSACAHGHMSGSSHAHDAVRWMIHFSIKKLYIYNCNSNNRGSPSNTTAAENKPYPAKTIEISETRKSIVSAYSKKHGVAKLYIQPTHGQIHV